MGLWNSRQNIFHSQTERQLRLNYVLKNTAYRGETETVEELYVSADEYSTYYHTNRLSHARIWNTFDDAVDWDYKYGGRENKAIKIEDKDLFEARLTGK